MKSTRDAVAQSCYNGCWLLAALEAFKAVGIRVCRSVAKIEKYISLGAVIVIQEKRARFLVVASRVCWY